MGAAILPAFAWRRANRMTDLVERGAEAIAFVVCQTIGLNAGHASAGYIHLYHGNAAFVRPVRPAAQG